MDINRVLLVDDDSSIRRIGELSLKKIGGFETFLASSGAEGLQMAATSRPDVILLDVMMPGMDGPATLEKLRTDPKTASIPVIFLTAKVQESDRQRYLALGAAGTIPKPFDPMTLHIQVRALLDKAARS